MKYIYYKDDDFSLEYEIHDDKLFLHCDVSSWRLSSFKKGLSVFNSFLEEAKSFQIEGVYTLTPNPKFAELLAGKFVKNITIDEKEVKVYKWELR